MAIKNGLCLEGQSGAALVIALVMIIVLTVIALATSLTSIFEIKLSGNKRGSTDAFYTADGGVQATIANLANLDTSSFTQVANTGGIPQDLRNQSIDSKLTSPTFPSGITFKDKPQVIIYHPVRTNAPRGSGSSAMFTYQYFVIDTIGRDQTETDLLKSTCHIMETVVRIMPSSQGGPG